MTAMIEVARNSVQEWHIDQMGHMNVQFYVDCCADGVGALAVHLGLGKAYAVSHGQRLVADNQHIRFLRERRSGAPYYVRAGVLDAADERLSVYLEMIGTTDGTVAATFTLDLSLRDVTTHATTALPQCALERARALLVEAPEHGRPRGVDMAPPRPALSLQDADAMGLMPTFQAMIRPQQCDSDGWLGLRQFMAIASDAVPNLMAQIRGGNDGYSDTVGGAALEYRFVYRRYPRADDVLVLRSGLKQVGAKAYTWCHCLFDVETGEAVASIEAVGVLLDLKARKAIAIPDAMRAHLSSLVVDGLGV